MITNTEINHEFLLHEVKLEPDELEVQYLVQMGHAVRRARNWAITQYNESRMHHGGNEAERLLTFFTKARSKNTSKKKKKKKRKKKKKLQEQRLLQAMCPRLSWTTWISLSAFEHEFWGLVREYWEDDAPAMRGWHYRKQFTLSAEDVRISECGRLLGIVTEEWDDAYHFWDDEEEDEPQRWTIWIQMDKRLAIDDHLLIGAEFRQENYKWFARVFEDVLPDRGENVVAVSLKRAKTAITDGRQALLLGKTYDARPTNLAILHWVIARHAGQVVVGSIDKASEMYQDLKILLEGMGFDFVTQEQSDVSKICPYCKHPVRGPSFAYCKQCRMVWDPEVGRASNILAKFLGPKSSRPLYPHTTRFHHPAEWPGW